VRQPADEAGGQQRGGPDGQCAAEVAEQERDHEADEQSPPRQPGAERGDDRGAHDHAERVGGDDVACGGDVDADALGDLRQHAHRHELGRADGEAAQREGDDRGDDPPGAELGDVGRCTHVRGARRPTPPAFPASATCWNGPVQRLAASP
jgi:hypothetical protein